MEAVSLIDIVGASATTAAVLVALWSGHRALSAQRRGIQVDGRRQAAIDIVRWLQHAETAILAWHNPESWRVTEDMQFGPDSGIKPGDIVPPSQGRMGPSLEATIQEFHSVRGLARLAFGPRHEVTALLSQVIDAIQHVADRGVIYADEQGPTPRQYVDSTFLPLAADLFEALAEATELREPHERMRRSGISAGHMKPAGYR